MNIDNIYKLTNELIISSSINKEYKSSIITNNEYIYIVHINLVKIIMKNKQLNLV